MRRSSAESPLPSEVVPSSNSSTIRLPSVLSSASGDAAGGGGGGPGARGGAGGRGAGGRVAGGAGGRVGGGAGGRVGGGAGVGPCSDERGGASGSDGTVIAATGSGERRRPAPNHRASLVNASIDSVRPIETVHHAEKCLKDEPLDILSAADVAAQSGDLVGKSKSLPYALLDCLRGFGGRIEMR